MSFRCRDCNTEIPGSNCAYTLAYEEGWKNLPGCYAHCRCGYPVRAKELRNFFQRTKDGPDGSRSAVGYIFAETSAGQGHVYYGTYYSCDRGNGLSASGLSSCAVFERYY